ISRSPARMDGTRSRAFPLAAIPLMPGTKARCANRGKSRYRKKAAWSRPTFLCIEHEDLRLSHEPDLPGDGRPRGALDLLCRVFRQPYDDPPGRGRASTGTARGGHTRGSADGLAGADLHRDGAARGRFAE